MVRQQLTTKIKSLWKWIVSGLVAMGAAIGVFLHWLAGGAATTAVVKTAAVGTVVAAAAAFSVNFGDKGSDILKHVEKSYTLLSEGKKGEAYEHFEKVSSALDSHIETLKEEMDSKEDPEDSLKKVTTIDNNLKQQKLLQLVKADLQLESAEGTEADWKNNFLSVLKENESKAGDVLALYFQIKRDNFPEAGIWNLLKEDISPEIRGQLALGLAQRHPPQKDDLLEKEVEFYTQLLEETSTSTAAPEILFQFIQALDNKQGPDRQKARKISEDLLDTYITLFPDYPLGAQAVSLQLGRLNAGPERDQKVIQLVEQYSGSLLSKTLVPAYVNVLLRQRKFKKAIAIISSDNPQQDITNQRQLAQAFWQLANKAVAIREFQFPSRSGDTKKTTGKKTSSLPAPKEICLGMAREFYESGEYSIAAELYLLSLQKEDSAPLHLVTQLPVQNLIELGYTGDPDSARAISEYLMALVESRSGEHRDNDVFLQAMLIDKFPEGLRPYVLEMKARSFMASDNYQAAREAVDSAMEILPTSPVLASLKVAIDRNQQMQAMKDKFQKEQKEHLILAQRASSPYEAIGHYRKVAELYLAMNDYEQAIGTYLLVVEKYPSQSIAPHLLLECIRILKNVDAKKHAGRIKTFTEKLTSTYPDSEEARELSVKDVQKNK